jgi:hypothetical protein
LNKTATAADSTLRIVGWNANGGLAGRKAACLAALNPDVAVVAECAQDAEVPALMRVGWTGTYRTKSLGVFARPELGETVDSSWDSSREWFLPVHLGEVGVDVLAVWAMNLRGGEGQPRWRTRRALGHYAPFLARGRALLIGDFNIGDFNDNLRWDRPTYPAFARTLEELGAKGYTSIYHARTGERHGAETGASIYWRRKLEAPYLIDHAFIPEAWLSSVLAPAVVPAFEEVATPQREVGAGGHSYRADYGIETPTTRLAIELDGYEFHGDRAAFSYDRLRQNDLLAAGWETVHFSYDAIRLETARSSRPEVREARTGSARGPVLGLGVHVDQLRVRRPVRRIAEGAQ